MLCQGSVIFIASPVTLSNSSIPAQFVRPAPFGNRGIKPAQPRPSLNLLSLLNSLQNTYTADSASSKHENQGRCVNSLGDWQNNLLIYKSWEKKTFKDLHYSPNLVRNIDTIMHLNYYPIWAISYFDLMWGPLLNIWHQTWLFVLFFQYLVCLLRNIVVFYQNKQYPIYLFSENKNSMLEAEIRSLQRRLVRRDNDILKQERELHKLRVSK